MKDNLNILILGHGDREKALATALLRSPRCKSLFLQIPEVNQTLTADVNEEDFDDVARFCSEQGIDILIPGPERLIHAGIREAIIDNPLSESVKVITPGREGAMLEGSKEYAKEFMMEEGIPSPRFMPVDSETLDEGLSFLDSLPGPYVLKADGLADGKGVFITSDLDDAKDILHRMLEGLLGEASKKVLIEEFVDGAEVTVMIATDGEDYIILPPARDYKRRFDSDRGPNTRGMGSYSPVGFADAEFMEKVRKRIIFPTLRGLKSREIPYNGFLYFGLMNIDGEPVLIEYNVRLGDPETQAVMPRIESDFMEIIEGIADSTVGLKRIQVSPTASVAVVGLLKTELSRENSANPSDSGKTSEKRITMTGTASTLEEAAAIAYSHMENLSKSLPTGESIEYRSDIAADNASPGS